MGFSRQESWSGLPCPPPGDLPNPRIKPIHMGALLNSLHLKCVCVCLVAQSVQLCDPKGCSPPGSSVHGDSPGKNPGVGCQALLQGIFPTQGLNPGLLYWQILYCLSHQRSPIYTHSYTHTHTHTHIWRHMSLYIQIYFPMYTSP